MIEVNGLEFRSQEKLKEYVRGLIENNQGILTPESNLWDFFKQLINRHPEADRKIGCGLSEIILGKNFVKANAVFLKRLDGSETDISWVVCVTGRPKTDRANLIAAMRLAVVEEIKFFLESNKSTHCGICNRPLEGVIHADHEIPFRELAKRFLDQEEIHPKEFDDHPERFMAKFKESDIDFEKRWKEFHFYEATLRKTHALCNLERR